jgi:hypothetical protein
VEIHHNKAPTWEMEAPFDVSGYSFKCNYGDLYHNVIDTSRLSMGFSKLSDKKIP